MKAIFTLDEIRQYGQELSVPIMVRSVDLLLDFQKRGLYTSMWQTAATAPHRFADLQNQKILVILDEFQNIASYIYDPHFPDKPIESLAGSFHSLSESKIAPMLVTGSYVRWLIHIMDKYLEAGRLSRIFLNPYLTPEEGLEAVYKYAEVYRQPVTNETALLINQLCFSDPFFISCILQSRMKNRDLTTSEGVSVVVNYEITNRESEMSMTWREYIELTLSSINNRNTKAILLYLSKHNERFWRPRELKEALDLELPEQEIQRQLLILAESDLIKRGISDIQFGGLKDGTLNLVLRNRYGTAVSTGPLPGSYFSGFAVFSDESCTVFLFKV